MALISGHFERNLAPSSQVLGHKGQRRRRGLHRCVRNPASGNGLILPQSLRSFGLFYSQEAELEGWEVEWDESVHVVDRRAWKASVLAGHQRREETLSVRKPGPHIFRATLAAGKKKKP